MAHVHEDALRLLADDRFEALITDTVPFVGYAFSEGWATRNRAALDGFLAASRRARAVLAEHDEEWERIAPLTGAASTAELHRLREIMLQHANMAANMHQISAERQAAAEAAQANFFAVPEQAERGNRRF